MKTIFYDKSLIFTLPIIVPALTIMFIMLSIACKRNHIFTIILTIIGLSSTLISLLYIYDKIILFTSTNSLIIINHYSIFYIGLILISSIFICLYSYYWLNKKNIKKNDEFYILLILATIGCIVLSITNHFYTLFLGIELLSLPLLGMIYYVHQKYSLESSIKYMLISAVSSSFLLFGIALLYYVLGSLSFYELNNIIQRDILYSPPTIFLIGVSMIIISFSVKLSLFPFNLWTPDTYQGTPIPVLMVFSIAKMSIFFSFMQCFYCLNLIEIFPIKILLEIIIYSSIIFSNIMALKQYNIKRLLGYTSISYIGYILVILLVPKYDMSFAIETVLMYFFGYIIVILVMLGVINLISITDTKIHNKYIISNYEGLFWRDPYLAIMLSICIFSLLGMPMTVGFVSKFYLFLLGIKINLLFYITFLIISTAISSFYYLRIISIIYNIPNKIYPYIINEKKVIFYKYIMLIPTFIIVFLGVYPQPIINFIYIITKML